MIYLTLFDVFTAQTYFELENVLLASSPSRRLPRCLYGAPPSVLPLRPSIHPPAPSPLRAAPAVRAATMHPHHDPRELSLKSFFSFFLFGWFFFFSGCKCSYAEINLSASKVLVEKRSDECVTVTGCAQDCD